MKLYGVQLATAQGTYVYMYPLSCCATENTFLLAYTTNTLYCYSNEFIHFQIMLTHCLLDTCSTSHNFLSLHIYYYTVLGHNLDFANEMNPCPFILMHCLPAEPLVHLLQKLPQDNPLLAVTLNNNHRCNTTHDHVFVCIPTAVQFKLHQEHCLQFAACILETLRCTMHVQIGCAQIIPCGTGKHQQARIGLGGWIAILLPNKCTLGAHMLYTIRDMFGTRFITTNIPCISSHVYLYLVLHFKYPSSTTPTILDDICIFSLLF